MTGTRGVDPELRFQRATEWSTPSEHRPELGSCLIYIGADNGNGYGQFFYNGRNGYAHRYAWERIHGPIPDGLTVDHLCRVRMCCNVEHLELTDAVDNYLRGVAARTHCRNGHAYPKVAPGTKRRCRQCMAAAWQKGYNQHHARAARGLPDRRVKYDQVLLADVLFRAASGEITTKQAAEEIGCSVKYADKRIRKQRRELGLPDRHPRKATP